ncbi:hypothetical protein [Sorangium sp. So ce1389]|uniref:hypothetical protein n=1 Tax=Sorangium sp. So ce1389 TaxID=3133336 RepID=UPI003F5E0170
MAARAVTGARSPSVASHAWILKPAALAHSDASITVLVNLEVRDARRVVDDLSDVLILR